MLQHVNNISLCLPNIFLLPWDAFLFTKKLEQILDWLPVDTLYKFRTQELNNLEAILDKKKARKYYKDDIYKSSVPKMADRGLHMRRKKRASNLHNFQNLLGQSRTIFLVHRASVSWLCVRDWNCIKILKRRKFRTKSETEQNSKEFYYIHRK